MTELEIGVDEGILLETDAAALVSNGGISIEWLVLTDKNLYIVTKHKTGLFSSEQHVRSVPLSTIMIVNGKPLVTIVNTDQCGHCLQIQSASGRELIYFYDAPKKNATAWLKEIYELLGAQYVPEPTVADSIISGVAGIASGFKQKIGAAVQAAPLRTDGRNATLSWTSGGLVSDPQVPAFSPNQDAISGVAGVYCTHCGKAIAANSRFCPLCGEKASAGDNILASPLKDSDRPVQSEQIDLSQRRVEYQGVLHKCPNCGGDVDPLDAVCDLCGYRISGRAANATVMEFSRQLMTIEGTRKRRSIFNNSLAPDVTDRQIVSLINTFPIPNNIEELTEFMFMSASNIDPRYSKKGMFGSSLDATAEGIISNAWLAKMQQVYKKAEISFSDDPLFEQIRQTYFAKMRELKRL